MDRSSLGNSVKQSACRDTTYERLTPLEQPAKRLSPRQAMAAETSPAAEALLRCSVPSDCVRNRSRKMLEPLLSICLRYRDPVSGQRQCEISVNRRLCSASAGRWKLWPEKNPVPPAKLSGLCSSRSVPDYSRHPSLLPIRLWTTRSLPSCRPTH